MLTGYHFDHLAFLIEINDVGEYHFDLLAFIMQIAGIVLAAYLLYVLIRTLKRLEDAKR